jgi:hypothetical protein
VSTVVHASGCAPLLLYVLLYGLDTYMSRQLGQAPASTPTLLALASYPRSRPRRLPGTFSLCREDTGS